MLTLLALLTNASLTGCDPSVSKPGDDTGAGSVDATDDGTGPGTAPAECDPTTAHLPAQQLRLLTRREYAATVLDLFGLVDAGGSWEVSLDGYGDAWSVHLAGSFNDWAPSVSEGGWPLSWDGAAWTGAFELDAGTYDYKFVIDESDWIADPANPDGIDDGFGGWNSRIQWGGDAPDPAAELPVESRPQGFLFDNNAASGLVTTTHAERYLEAASDVAAAALAAPGAWLPCESIAPSDPEACAADFARDFGLRAWRRPLSDDEQARIVARVLAGDTFADGLTVAVEILLSSPDFLYRSELGEAGDDGTWRLTPWETAAALSYLLWGTTPDDALLADAAAGALDDAAGIEAAARRMLDDPRAAPLLEAFAVQWLGAEDVLFSEAALKDDMLAETAGFFQRVVTEGSGTLEELLTADYTAASAALADAYGAGSPDADGWVALPPERSGILSHGAVLTTTAHSDQTSPILRGLFVRENLLCQTLGAPPAAAGGVPDVDPDATTRERYEQHTADPTCYACHQYIDPVGFGFEHFDQHGQWRDTENGYAIDAAGDMNDVEGLGSGTSAPFEGLPALAATLAASERAHTCFTLQTWRFALGGLERDADACAVEELSDAFLASGGDIRELLVALATSEGFVNRETP